MVFPDLRENRERREVLVKQEILERQGGTGGMENEVQKVIQDKEALLDLPEREDQQEIQDLQDDLVHKYRESLYLAHLDLVELMAMLVLQD